MKTLILKSILYSILVFICLEFIVRVLHLYQQYPPYTINDLNLEVNTPNQKGYYVTGNRRMNFAEYNINKSGFMSNLKNLHHSTAAVLPTSRQLFEVFNPVFEGFATIFALKLVEDIRLAPDSKSLTMY